MSTGEYIAIIICPIVTTLALVFGGLFAFFKYRASKNYDINLKILSTVYLPLYSYIIKQEVYRYIVVDKKNKWEDSPILDINNNTTKTSFTEKGIEISTNSEPVCGLTPMSLTKVLKENDLGLASTELVTLLNLYEVLIHITNAKTNSKEKAGIMKVKVEHALRKEIMRGYKYYHKKLKLHNSESGLFTLNDRQICFNLDISDEEIKETFKNIEQSIINRNRTY